jgi:hypothetical protein
MRDISESGNEDGETDSIDSERHVLSLALEQITVT